MTSLMQPQLFVAGLAGLSSGAVLFFRGLEAYRRGSVVSSIATSSIDALAVGEVRLSGTVEPLAATLISPLQSQPCVWYRSSIVETGRGAITLLDEEQSVEFQLRDVTGAVRIIPRGARWELPTVMDEETGLFGDVPVGLRRRTGPASTAVAEFDREAAIADLLTVRPATPGETEDGGVLEHMHQQGGGTRHYVESRLEPGQTVTIVGFAQPFGQLNDADTLATAGTGDDAAIGREIAEARAAGLLAASAEEAWGNAAIPGFAIGRPAEEPELEAGARPMPVASDAQVHRADQIFSIPPETMVVSGGPGTELVIYAGTPTAAHAHDQFAFYRGLAGAGLATISAVGLALMINGGL